MHTDSYEKVSIHMIHLKEKNYFYASRKRIELGNFIKMKFFSNFNIKSDSWICIDSPECIQVKIRFFTVFLYCFSKEMWDVSLGKTLSL
ncbi:hypothetical protein TNIN_399861 [Trichonephila inaurata madagascariensis]|uniref:Uncharacterized protein n=1 Tax=Trichonephila inaurata madagascariensis TaxID=2747483 RepID=A0A8X6M7Y1_9ARAC|nr:hypothetical protein TNIN_399861 [Trichonephila inaurata madagascariensis]